jgi:hypothetical protein
VYFTIPCVIAPFEIFVIIVTKSFSCPMSAKPVGPATTLFITNADITVDIAVRTDVLLLP